MTSFSRLLVAAIWLFALMPTVQAQQYTPTFSFASMLDGYFDDSSGLVSFGDYIVAFAPEGQFNGQAVVINDQTEVLAQYQFFPDYALREGVFGRVRIQGPADVMLTEPGTYFLVFLVDGQPVSRLPFVLRQTSAGDDPFNPEKTFAFDGYWRTFAYITNTTFQDEPVPELNFWIGGMDMPEGAPRGRFFVQLIRDGEVVAHSRRTVGSIAPGHFEWTRMSLSHPHPEGAEANAPLFMLDDWQVDGLYEVRITRNSDGQMLRSFDFEVAGGEIQPHPRSALGYEPQHDYIVPRVARRGASSLQFIEATWIEDRQLR